MAVTVLPYNSKIQLSQHINAGELRCKCYGTHTITVNSELIDKIEKLLDVVAKARNIESKDVKIYISSANRCKQHDINVGGSGWGMHVVGKALDFCVSAGKTTINSKVLACIAQEIGFTGIGRINETYIHCDVGTLAEHGGKKWLGDETVKGGTSGSIINEPDTYWRYYKINREEWIKEDAAETLERRLQRELNALGESLTVDGIIGEKTIEAMKKHAIKQGDKSDYVKVMQELFNSKGYDCGTPDGIAGTKTMAAIFQTAVTHIFS